MTRSRWVATAMLAVAFALGGLAGGAATMLADRDDGRGRRNPYSHESFAARLSKELSLTAEQEQSVIDLLVRHQPVMDSIWASVREPFRAEMQATRDDIRRLLTPEQLAEYNIIVARQDSAWKAKGKHHGSR